MSALTIILIVLIVMMITSLPQTGIHPYGWGPSGALTVVIVILLVLLLMGRL